MEIIINCQLSIVNYLLLLHLISYVISDRKQVDTVNIAFVNVIA